MVSTLPTPGITPPNWGQQMNDAVESRYTETQTELATKASIAYEMSGVVLAHAENATGTSTSVAVSAAASALIPGCLITVPANEDPVFIEYGAAASVGTSGGGLVSLEIWDVTAGGVGTILHASGLGFVTAQVTLYSGGFQTMRGRYLLDLSTSDRLVRLKAILYRDSGGLTASVLNAARGSAGGGQPSYITAVHG